LGKGSVKKDKNSWYFIVDVGVDNQGRRKQKRKRGFGSELEAYKGLSNYLINQKESDSKKLKNGKPSLQTFEHIPEDTIENILINNLEEVEKGLTYLDRQVHIENGVIDILAEDSEGTKVIIEVKNNPIDQRIVSQAIYYPLVFDEKCRFITIASDYDNKVIFCLNEINRNIHKVEMKLIEKISIQKESSEIKVKDFY